jgi:hypothetical protein
MNHDYILLDRSGSMREAGKWTESIAAINNYVRGLAERKVDTGVTLALIDKPDRTMEFEILRDRIIPSTWRDVAIDEAHPRGWTPLNEGLLRMIEIANRAGHRPNDHVVIVVLTDGLENASDPIKAPHEEVKKALDSCRARGWEIIFIGAAFDNWSQARGYGALRASSYSAEPLNLGKTMGVMSANRASKVAGASATMDFSDEQKAELDKTNK